MSKLSEVFNFCLIPVVFFLSIAGHAQVVGPEYFEICEGEPITLEPGFSQSGDDLTYTWYHDSNGDFKIVSGMDDDIEYLLDDNENLTIDGLIYEPTANTYIQSTTYNYYVELAGSNVPQNVLKHIKVKVFDVPELQTIRPLPVCDPNGSVDLSKSIEGFDPTVFDYEIISPSGDVIAIDDLYNQKENGTYSVRSSYKDFQCWSPWRPIDLTIALSELQSAFVFNVDLGMDNIQQNGIAQVLQPVDFIDMTPWDVSSWHWDFGDGNEDTVQHPTHAFAATGTYLVVLTAVDDTGCSHSFERMIEVRDDYMIIIPNAFSPSGKKNNHFKPEYKGVVSMEFFVFNTWGELIFATQHLDSEGWDGNWKGKKAPEGNYIYKGIFITSSREEIIKDGVFLLIR